MRRPRAAAAAARLRSTAAAAAAASAALWVPFLLRSSSATVMVPEDDPGRTVVIFDTLEEWLANVQSPQERPGDRQAPQLPVASPPGTRSGPLYHPHDLRRASLAAVSAGEPRRLPDRVVEDVAQYWRDPFPGAPYMGMWITEEEFSHRDLVPPRPGANRTANTTVAAAAGRARAGGARDEDRGQLRAVQQFEFVPDGQGSMECYVSTFFDPRLNGPAVLVDKLLLQVAYGPEGPLLRGEGACSYIAAAAHRSTPPDCAYTFLRRGADLVVSLCYELDGQVVRREYLACRETDSRSSGSRSRMSDGWD